MQRFKGLVEEAATTRQKCADKRREIKNVREEVMCVTTVAEKLTGLKDETFTVLADSRIFKEQNFDLNDASSRRSGCLTVFENRVDSF